MTGYIRSVTQGPPLRATYPHCDFRVLHAPGACAFYDARPDWQRERLESRVLFTGDPRNADLVDAFLLTGLAGDETPCPAELARGELCQLWPGNKAVKG